MIVREISASTFATEPTLQWNDRVERAVNRIRAVRIGSGRNQRELLKRSQRTTGRVAVVDRNRSPCRPSSRSHSWTIDQRNATSGPRTRRRRDVRSATCNYAFTSHARIVTRTLWTDRSVFRNQMKSWHSDTVARESIDRKRSARVEFYWHLLNQVIACVLEDRSEFQHCTLYN